MKSRVLSLIAGVVMLFVVLSCQLADSGRMGALQISIEQPDIMAPLLQDSFSTGDRILMPETGSIGIILYPEFSGDTLTADSTPSRAQLDSILSRNETRVILLNLSIDQSINQTIGDIAPGKWNILAATFLSPSVDVHTVELADDALTFRTKLDVEIGPGFNSVDLPLYLNLNRYTDLGSNDGSTYANIQTEEIIETSVAPFFGYLTTPLGITNLFPGINTIPVDSTVPNSILGLYVVYDGMGRYLDSTSSPAGVLSFRVTDSSEVFIITGTPIGIPLFNSTQIFTVGMNFGSWSGESTELPPISGILTSMIAQ